MQRGLYESSDIQAAIQQAIMQGNPGVLRGVEGGTLHFVAVQRSGDQEYIDHVCTTPPVNNISDCPDDTQYNFRVS